MDANPQQVVDRRIGVVGCGQMGAGIAEMCARAGLDVVVVESDADGARRGRTRIEASLARAVRSGRLDEDGAQAVFGRLALTAALDALADRTLVIEAVAEREDVKTGVMAALDRIVTDPDAVLATNTSSIPIMRLATATSRPSQVIGLHFFNPVPVLRLVEIVPSLLTSQATRVRATAFVTETLGKHAVPAPDRAGFVVNTLLIPYLLSAVRMAESGFAPPEDIDAGMVLGCAHPMGPLRLADLIGLDTVQAAAEAMYAEYRDLHFAPPALLLRMVEGGRLGRKTGRGFYEYTAA
ncbi:3-hydroxybutyryl-CoA dehydrogenase [Kitasatospora paranensis]|uniref:3-hydroxybutyryl-CoA dehydrogenase n=1 Tax=Kitasatospora paranensis TaxID=258053 RepID=A0ABW2G484_9ACTN